MSDERLALRIDKLITHSKGTMPIGVIVDSAQEAAKAKEILAHSGKRGKHVIVWVHQDGQDIRACAARPEVLDLHLQGRGDVCEGIGQGAMTTRSRRSRSVVAETVPAEKSCSGGAVS